MKKEKNIYCNPPLPDKLTVAESILSKVLFSSRNNGKYLFHYLTMHRQNQKEATGDNMPHICHNKMQISYIFIFIILY